MLDLNYSIPISDSIFINDEHKKKIINEILNQQSKINLGEITMKKDVYSILNKPEELIVLKEHRAVFANGSSGIVHPGDRYMAVGIPKAKAILEELARPCTKEDNFKFSSEDNNDNYNIESLKLLRKQGFSRDPNITSRTRTAYKLRVSFPKKIKGKFARMNIIAPLSVLKKVGWADGQSWFYDLKKDSKLFLQQHPVGYPWHMLPKQEKKQDSDRRYELQLVLPYEYQQILKNKGLLKTHVFIHLEELLFSDDQLMVELKS